MLWLHLNSWFGVRLVGCSLGWVFTWLGAYLVGCSFGWVFAWLGARLVGLVWLVWLVVVFAVMLVWLFWWGWFGWFGVRLDGVLSLLMCHDWSARSRREDWTKDVGVAVPSVAHITMTLILDYRQI